MIKPLDGITVLEQGTFITGPAAGMLLADMGARVIKVEQPGTGDPFRAFSGGLWSPHFQAFNRNKESVTLDLKLAEDAAVFDELVRTADVYLQNFRPGAAERMGVGHQRLRSLNPRLIYAAISGFGPSGPSALRPVYDTVAQAASGYLSQLLNPANPRVVGAATADILTGFYTAYGIMAALIERSRIGRGRLVEVSMLEAMCHFGIDAFLQYFTVGEVMGPFTRARYSQSYVLRCADERWIALHMSSPEKFWRNLAQAIERPWILDDPRFSTREARIENQESMIGILSVAFAARPRDEWCRLLAQHDVPHSPVHAADEAIHDPQVEHLHIVVDVPRPGQAPWRTIRSPVNFDGGPMLEVRLPPRLGEHNDDVVEPLRRRIAQVRPSTRSGSA